MGTIHYGYDTLNSIAYNFHKNEIYYINIIKFFKIKILYIKIRFFLFSSYNLWLDLIWWQCIVKIVFL